MHYQLVPGGNKAINPFDTNRAVGMLLYAEYPSTAVFIDEEGQPIIREWIDCTDDGVIDKYFYFKTNANNLKLFIEGEISHRAFVKAAEGELYYFEDKTAENLIISSIIYASNFPAEYYPGEVFISPEEVVDIDEVYSAFELYNAEIVTLDEQVKAIAREEGSETYNLHIREGHGVGYGKIRTDLYGRILVNFDSLFQEAAIDQFVGKGTASKKERAKHDRYINTEVYYNIAASYSVLIKPIDHVSYEDNDGEKDTSSGRIAQTIFNLINQSTTGRIINDRASDYSPRVMNAYRTFIQNIKESGVDLDFSWYNPESRIMHSAALTHDKTTSIFSNIESLTSTTEKQLTKIGKFEHINCTTGYFGFLSGEIINGYFDLSIKEQMRQVNFVDAYEVKITELTTVIPGKSEPRVENTLNAYYKRSASGGNTQNSEQESKSSPGNVRRIG
jgi:hypothetical protein